MPSVRSFYLNIKGFSPISQCNLTFKHNVLRHFAHSIEDDQNPPNGSDVIKGISKIKLVFLHSMESNQCNPFMNNLSPTTTDSSSLKKISRDILAKTMVRKFENVPHLHT